MNTLRTFCIYALFLILLIPTTGLTQGQSKPFEIGQIFTMYSEILEEERSYWVSIPDEYNDSTYTPRPYPVLYLLDASRFFHPVTGMVKYMNLNPQIPEMIIVGIPNTNRTRDLFPTHSKVGYDGQMNESLEETGGGEVFLDFIRKELFPVINREYRTLPYRIIVGHSAGGLLALYSFFEHPDMFQAYLAFDPAFWWDDELLLRELKEINSSLQNRRDAVYISLVNKLAMPESFNLGRAHEAQQRFIKQFQSLEAPKMRTKSHYFETENHLTIPLRSIYHGLLFVFEGYQPPDEMLYNSPSALIDHFERVSHQLGVELLPSELTLNEIGYALMYEESPGKALKVFEGMVHFYPQSAPAYAGIGTVHLVKGDTASAIDAFHQALLHNPENEKALQALQKLEKRDTNR